MKIPRPPGERIKTDRRDALKLASLCRAGELICVSVPDERVEAMRDRSRARLKARQQLEALLLRRGQRYTGKSYCPAAHERCQRVVSFAHPAQDLAFMEHRLAFREARDRVERIGESLRRPRPGAGDRLSRP